jgi:peroxiredoxin (alkyl hydroperoxide reductase subunit C)
VADDAVGCARVTGTVETSTSGEGPEAQPRVEQEVAVTARVGQQAPDFVAPAYHRGDFTSVRLSDYAGKWVLMCFYPGDFTFV